MLISKEKKKNELHFQSPKVGKKHQELPNDYVSFSMCCPRYRNNYPSSIALIDLI
jgi:hypothetical protein